MRFKTATVLSVHPQRQDPTPTRPAQHEGAMSVLLFHHSEINLLKSTNVSKLESHWIILDRCELKSWTGNESR